MTWTILCIAAFWFLASPLSVGATVQCHLCHNAAVRLDGAHQGFACQFCHQRGNTVMPDPAHRSVGSAGCVGCHRGYQQMYDHAMGTRGKEKAFIARSYGKRDGEFEKKNCVSCHIQSCRDCHGKGHAIARPKADACSKCHRGYFVGWDYFGRAPREEHERYQRGDVINGETFLKMLPDVHQKKGMTCAACHTMQSLITGKTAAKSCTDCHRPRKDVIEHRIAAHLEKMECIACHAAWAPQEYGTFFLHFTSGSVDEPFQVLTSTGNGYAKTVYLKRQDLPPLGVNSQGKVAPIRPQFIAYYTQLSKGRAVGRENELLAAEWRAFTPHTVQRGTAMCDGCHDNPQRFLLEDRQSRIYDLQKDGMTLSSFWDRRGQQVINGSFLEEARYRQIAARSTAYKKAYVEKWRRFALPPQR